MLNCQRVYNSFLMTSSCLSMFADVPNYIYIYTHSTLYRPIKQTNSLKTFRMSVFPLYLKLFICSIVSSAAIHEKLVHLTSATTTVAPCAAAARALTHGKPSAPLVLLNLAGHHLRTPYSIPTICLVT